MKFFKKHGFTLLFGLMVLTGFSIMMYPSFCDWYNQLFSSKMIESYDDAVEKLDTSHYKTMYQQAEQANAYILDNLPNWQLDETQNEQYNNILDTVQGMMGYLEIPKIDVRLPIYHGVEENVLSVGIGHLPGSSFPVGGPGSHAVLTGHTGLSTARLFTDLDQLKPGDVIYIHMLSQTMAYEVESTEVVLPDEAASLMPEASKDQITLVTCTPYGINSHRLLVHAVRIPYEKAAEQIILSSSTIPWKKYLPAVCAGLCMLVFLLILVHIQKKEKQNENN